MYACSVAVCDCDSARARSLLSGTEDVYHAAGSESDSSDQLIVDESKAQRPHLKPGSLKMRLPGTAVQCSHWHDIIYTS